MARKPLMLDLLQKGMEQERSFYHSLSEEDKNRAGKVDDWSAKDAIAHVAYWKQYRVADIQRLLEGQPVSSIDDFDLENEKIFDQFSDHSWDEVMAYSEQSAAVLSKQLQDMSEAELEREWHNDRPIWSVIITNGYSHPLMHISEHYQQQGDMQRAAEITGLLGQPMAALDDSPRWTGTVHYNVACSYALLGDKETALKELAQALELTPQLTEWSKEDPDLVSLHNEPAYQALYE